MNTHTRYSTLDYLRAFAILLMVIYHLSFDLAYYQFIQQTTFYGQPLTAIGRICLCTFLFCVGYSLGLSHGKGIRWQNFSKRWLKIAFCASLVSIGSYIAYPHHWIYFGILHHIAVMSILALPFLKIPIPALIIGIAIMSVYLATGKTLPWFHLGRPSMDYISVFPWGGMVLAGIGAQHFQLLEKIQLPRNRFVELLSRQSLIIYLVHQPILMGGTWLAWKISQ